MRAAPRMLRRGAACATGVVSGMRAQSECEAAQSAITILALRCAALLAMTLFAADRGV